MQHDIVRPVVTVNGTKAALCGSGTTVASRSGTATGHRGRDAGLDIRVEASAGAGAPMCAGRSLRAARAR